MPHVSIGLLDPSQPVQITMMFGVSGTGDHSGRFSILNPDGNQIFSTNNDTFSLPDMSPFESIVNLTLGPLTLWFKSEGDYRIQVAVDGEVLYDETFNVYRSKLSHTNLGPSQMRGQMAAETPMQL